MNGQTPKERMSLEKCVSVQIYSPFGLPEINDFRVTHYFILTMLLFSEFYFLTLWKHILANDVFISCCSEEEISLYVEELMSLVFALFVFYFKSEE